jgi:hypothetical protein
LIDGFLGEQLCLRAAAFQLLPETVEMLERYLSELEGQALPQAHPMAVSQFRGRADERHGPRGGSLCQKTKRELGVWITPL